MKANQGRTITLGDLAQLTLRGNVAFAVRCAHRIRPRFQLPSDAPRRREQIAAIDAAIRVATAYCQGQPLEPGRAAAAARAAAAVADETCESTSFAGFGAVRAAEAAANAEEQVRNPTDSALTEVVAAAFGAARVVAANASVYELDLIVRAMFADMEKLRSLQARASHDLGPAVDPSESGPLGPLWPEGAPMCFSATA